MMVAGGQRDGSGKYALPDTQNQAWSSDTTRFGSRMLAKMGWSSGKGLGKKEDGIVEHVRVVKRSEALGLGAKPAGAGGEAALSNAVADYNALLASLASVGSASAGGRAGGSAKRARSGSDSSAASSEAPRPKAPSAPVRIIGRFAHHKALRQKNVAGYSAADLQAILGTHTLGAGGAVGGAGEAVGLPSAPIVQRASFSLTVKKRKKEKKQAAAVAVQAEAGAEAPGAGQEAKEAKRLAKRARREAEAEAQAAAAAAAAEEEEQESKAQREARRAARKESKRQQREASGE